MTPSGTEKVLHSFTGNLGKKPDGAGPTAPLIFDAQNNLYGTAGGGVYGRGTVFKLSPSGKETLLYNFKGGTDGEAELPRPGGEHLAGSGA